MIAQASANYTEEMIETMTEQYVQNPCRETVDSLAAYFDKRPRSVISKLSALGIYQKPEANLTKSGATIVRKDEYVAQIEQLLGTSFASLINMTKADLESMVESLRAAK